MAEKKKAPRGPGAESRQHGGDHGPGKNTTLPFEVKQ
jgi:hypothetical protein